MEGKASLLGINGMKLALPTCLGGVRLRDAGPFNAILLDLDLDHACSSSHQEERVHPADAAAADKRM